MNEIFNETTIKEFIRLCSFGLVKGLGEPIEGKMCVEAAIARAHNLSHQDKNPSCVGEEVARVKIALNDCNWSSNEARAEGMKAIGIAQLGSNKLSQKLFIEQLKLNSTKILIPFLIQKHYKETQDKELLEYKKKFENLINLDDNLWKEFYNHYNYHYYNFYYHYNHYNYHYHYYNYYNHCFGDNWLNLVALTILKTLQNLNSPGCKYLYLLKQDN